MISVVAKPYPISKEHETALRKWLVDDAAKDFLEIVRGKAKEHGAKALNAAFQSTTFNSMSGQADAEMEAAKRYQSFLEVWEEVSSKPDNFYTVELK